MTTKKEKPIGVFDAGTRNVELYIREGCGAEFHMQPSEKDQARITIGRDQEWLQIIGCLTHEIMEFTLANLGLRFSPAPDISQDNGSYYFSMNHTQFSEATIRAGLFLAVAIPALKKALKKKK